MISNNSRSLCQIDICFRDGAGRKTAAAKLICRIILNQGIADLEFPIAHMVFISLPKPGLRSAIDINAAPTKGLFGIAITIHHIIDDLAGSDSGRGIVHIIQTRLDKKSTA